jgi:hypothetical protein
MTLSITTLMTMTLSIKIDLVHGHFEKQQILMPRLATNRKRTLNKMFLELHFRKDVRVISYYDRKAFHRQMFQFIWFIYKLGGK